jgi:hypothetical protein
MGSEPNPEFSILQTLPLMSSCPSGGGGGGDDAAGHASDGGGDGGCGGGGCGGAVEPGEASKERAEAPRSSSPAGGWSAYAFRQGMHVVARYHGTPHVGYILMANADEDGNRWYLTRCGYAARL